MQHARMMLLSVMRRLLAKEGGQTKRKVTKRHDIRPWIRRYAKRHPAGSVAKPLEAATVVGTGAKPGADRGGDMGNDLRFLRLALLTHQVHRVA